MSNRDTQRSRVDLGLAVLSTGDFIGRAMKWFPHDWQTRVQRYDVLAAASDCSRQHTRQECERVLAKVRNGLAARGIGLTEGLMILEAMAKERRCDSAKEPLDPPVYHG